MLPLRAIRFFVENLNHDAIVVRKVHTLLILVTVFGLRISTSTNSLNSSQTTSNQYLERNDLASPSVCSETVITCSTNIGRHNQAFYTFNAVAITRINLQTNRKV